MSDMVSKATAVKTGRQAGAHSVAELKDEGGGEEETHRAGHTHTYTHTL